MCKEWIHFLKLIQEKNELCGDILIFWNAPLQAELILDAKSETRCSATIVVSVKTSPQITCWRSLGSDWFTSDWAWLARYCVKSPTTGISLTHTLSCLQKICVPYLMSVVKWAQPGCSLPELVPGPVHSARRLFSGSVSARPSGSVQTWLPLNCRRTAGSGAHITKGHA